MTGGEGPQLQTQSQAQTQRPSRGGPHGHRRGRGRGGRGRGQSDGVASAGRNAPARDSVEATSSAPAQTQPAPDSSGSSRGGRFRRGQRGGRSAAQGGPPRPAAGRSFGGHLTSETEAASSQLALSLSGDAPEFVPGKPVTARSRTKAQGKETQRPKVPKSTAVDLVTRIHEDISHANYECTICTDEVLRNSHVWSCTVCWTVVHLKCAKRWHDNQKKQDRQLQQQQQRSELPRDPSWRCPGCNSKLTEEPSSYRCWCGKDVNPRPSSVALPPHSCGQTCSKPKGTCPHPCSLQCHAGPCPPCDLMGPTQSCFCGKNTSRKLCRETDYENGWSCKEICGDLLPCGEHICPMPCHSGLCGDCDLPVQAKCYCGRVEKEMPCYEQEEAQSSFSPKEELWFDGSFNCEQDCERPFDCGVHKCSETCHPQDEAAAHCPYSPDSVSHCPCGKTSLETLLNSPRTSCEDAVPHCDEPCEKPLRCGHLCKAKCHTGDCGFCRETVSIPCRCGRVTTNSMCHQGDILNPLCMRTCQANLNCGRHKCGERCCPGEKRAAERQAAKRKHKLQDQMSSIEAEHICIRTCGRPLKCGSHDCQQMCHRGPCGSCPEAIFHEISCNCGRTVLQPPQPCGTHVPDCRFSCQRRPECGHPPVDHNCHPDDLACPKCPFLVDKWCACGKEKLHSQPCHLQAAHCGRPCGKKLKCGLHNCRKHCHRPGECEDVAISGNHCEQPCGKVKMFCEHHCQKTCHGQTPCNESTACTSKAVISCPCGQRQQEVKCLASSSNPTPTRLEIKCDDECLRMDRNRRLAAALNIDPATHGSDHIPYSDRTLALFKKNVSWAETQEREFRVFSKSPNEVRLRYKAMPPSQREFLHVLAEDYGLQSMSEDTEPDRYVLVWKGSRFVSAPSKTVAQCVKIRATQAAEAAAASRPPSPPPLMKEEEPFNAFLLTSTRFGLTEEDVNSSLEADLASQPSLHFSVHFLPSEEVLIRATAPYSSFLSPSSIEQALTNMKPRIITTAKKLELAGNVLLCHINTGDHVSRREDLRKQDGTSGWSAVAGRAAGKKEATAGSGAEDAAGKGTGRKLLGLRKKKVEKEVGKTWAALDGDVEC